MLSTEPDNQPIISFSNIQEIVKTTIPSCLLGQSLRMVSEDAVRRVYNNFRSNYFFKYSPSNIILQDKIYYWYGDIIIDESIDDIIRIFLRGTTTYMSKTHLDTVRDIIKKITEKNYYYNPLHTSTNRFKNAFITKLVSTGVLMEKS